MIFTGIPTHWGCTGGIFIYGKGVLLGPNLAHLNSYPHVRPY